MTKGIGDYHFIWFDRENDDNQETTQDVHQDDKKGSKELSS